MFVMFVAEAVHLASIHDSCCRSDPESPLYTSHTDFILLLGRFVIIKQGRNSETPQTDQYLNCSSTIQCDSGLGSSDVFVHVTSASLYLTGF